MYGSPVLVGHSAAEFNFTENLSELMSELARPSQFDFSIRRGNIFRVRPTYEMLSNYVLMIILMYFVICYC